jgi:hypothetical protein
MVSLLLSYRQKPKAVIPFKTKAVMPFIRDKDKKHKGKNPDTPVKLMKDPALQSVQADVPAETGSHCHLH